MTSKTTPTQEKSDLAQTAPDLSLASFSHKKTTTQLEKTSINAKRVLDADELERIDKTAQLRAARAERDENDRDKS